jgi:hypothetical protein
MKNLKLLFLVALLSGFTLNSSAQSEVRYFEQTMTFRPNCDGVVDVITGPVHGHVVDHYNPKTGVFEWFTFNILGSALVSQTTGELFSISGKTNGKTEGDWAGTLGDTYIKFRRNLRGNLGSHYLVTIVWFYDAGTNTSSLLQSDIKCL